MKKLLAVAGIVWLTGLAVRADVIAVPPSRIKLTGTLAWSAEPQSWGLRGTILKDQLTVTDAKGKAVTVHLRQPDTPDRYEPFLGKEVILTVLTEGSWDRQRTEIVAERVIELKPAPAKKR